MRSGSANLSWIDCAVFGAVFVFIHVSASLVANPFKIICSRMNNSERELETIDKHQNRDLSLGLSLHYSSIRNFSFSFQNIGKLNHYLKMRIF